MNAEDREMEQLLTGAGLNAEPNPRRMETVYADMLKLTQAARPRHSTRRAVGLGALLLAGVATAGLAGTQAGRDWVRHVVIPVHQVEHVTLALPPDPSQPNTKGQMGVFRMSSGGNAKPFTPEEKAAMEAEMAEIMQIKQAGSGRLVGLMEVLPPQGSTPYTSFSVEYTLADGRTKRQADDPSPQQRVNMRIDEILKLRDSGAGQIVSSKPSDMGMGCYTIRFVLADGATIDLETHYPPGTGAERTAIFAETRQLRDARRFSVTLAVSGAGDGKVWGILHYTLADGRQVGLVGDVPADMVGPDGKTVISAETSQQSQPGQ